MATKKKTKKTKKKAATKKKVVKKAAKKATRKKVAKKRVVKKAAKKKATKKKATKKRAAPKKGGKGGAAKKVVKKKAAKKKSVRKTARRAAKPARRRQKRAGSNKTRIMVRDIGKRILAECAGQSPNDVAKRLGLDSYDIKNLRAGNLPSLDMVLKLVTKGRFSPESIIYGKSFKKLAPGVSTKNAQPRLINTRIRKLAASKPAQEWGNATGLAVHSIYQLRVSGARAGLHTVLGFLNAGIPLEEIFFGTKPRKAKK